MDELLLVCKACGTTLAVTDPTPAAAVACPACGKRVRLRDHLPAEPDPPPPPVHVSRPATAARRRVPRWAGPVGLAVIAGAAGAGVVLLIVRQGPPQAGPVAAAIPPAMVSPEPSAWPVDQWDSVRHRDLLRMQGEADDLVVAGDLRGAYDGYKRLLAVAAGHDLRDPIGRHIVQDVRSAQRRVFSTMLAAQAQPDPGGSPPVPLAKPMPEPVASATPQPEPVAPTGRRRRPRVTPHPTAPPPGPPLTPDQIRLTADTAPPLVNVPPRPTGRAYVPPDLVTDAEVGQAIDRAIVYLRTHPNRWPAMAGVARRRRAAGDLAPDGTDPLTPTSPLMPGMDVPISAAPGQVDTQVGETILATYALLNAGRATDTARLGPGDPAVTAALEQLKAYPLTSTYTHSLRAAALAVFNRIEDRKALEDDVRWLEEAQTDGAYSYNQTPAAFRARFPNGAALGPNGRFVNFGNWYNSNSQYGLLGVWSGALAGVPVPAGYWQAVAKHWADCATPDGRWGYDSGHPHPYLSMTLAGVASLLVSHEYLDAAAEADGGPQPPADLAALGAGLNWLDQGDNCLADPTEGVVAFAAYTHYGLERVGLASGYKYFGRHDWYAEVARELVDTQAAAGSAGDGSWDNSAVNTSYDLLFLARGRHPILFNKLRYAGDWADRPRDVEHLSRFASAQLERPLNWQVVDLHRPWHDWTDAPVLYISGDAPPDFTDADYAAVADYAAAGGVIFTHADHGSPAFTAWVGQLVRKSFPKYELTTVPKDHPLNTVLFRLKRPPPLQAVTNGSRLLLVHSPTTWPNTGGRTGRPGPATRRSSWGRTCSSTRPGRRTTATASPPRTCRRGRASRPGRWPSPGCGSPASGTPSRTPRRGSPGRSGGTRTNYWTCGRST